MAEEDISSNVDLNPLDEDDLIDTIKALTGIAANWRDIGIFLRIRPSQLETIQVQGYSPKDCMREVLITWLRRNYNVERFGEPTWAKLVEAVRHPAGGGNSSLAMKIASEHQGWTSGPRLSSISDYPLHLPPRDYLKEVDILGKISFLMTSQDQTFQWPGYGLKLHTPRGALPAGMKQCELLIKRVTSKQFSLPQNTTLVSAVYWLDSEPRCKFSKPLRVEIEHCAAPSETSRLSFARCSQNGPPYAFEMQEEGEFDTQSGYIQLHSFAMITQLLMTGVIKRPDIKYFARLYTVWKGVDQREMYFLITKDLEAHATEVQQTYTDKGAKQELGMKVEFELDGISLQLPPEETLLCGGWRLYPRFNPRITKKDVDNFETGQAIPSCHLTPVWTKQGEQPSHLRQKVTLVGATATNNYFNIVLDSTRPDTTGDHDQPQNFQLHKVDDTPLKEGHFLGTIMETVHTLTAKWFNLGLALGLSSDALSQIEYNYPRDSLRCLAEVIKMWLRNNPQSSWQGLASALRSPLVGGFELATEIAKKHPSH